MNEHTRYLDFVKFTDIVSRVDRQMDEHPDLRQQPGKCHLLLDLRVELVLVHICHNLTQLFLADFYGVSQSTVSRIISRLRPIMLSILEPFRPDMDDLARELATTFEESIAADEPPPSVLIDGTLVKEAWRRGNKGVYSGKHKAAGRNVQVVADEQGRLLYAGEPQPGKMHDRKAVAETGIEAAIAASGLSGCGDMGYMGTAFNHPNRSSKYHKLTIAEEIENRWINRLRAPVERCIGNIKGSLRILRTGIRVRGSERIAAVNETIVLAISLYFYRRDWRPKSVRA